MNLKIPYQFSHSPLSVFNPRERRFSSQKGPLYVALRESKGRNSAVKEADDPRWERNIRARLSNFETSKHGGKQKSDAAERR